MFFYFSIYYYYLNNKFLKFIYIYNFIIFTFKYLNILNNNSKIIDYKCKY